jgi:UDP-glucose 4-epimerase
MSAPRPRTVFITGGSGFIGGHLTEALLARGDTVLALDDLSTGASSNIQSFRNHERYHFARASLNDGVVLDRMASQADVIVHLAAAVGVQLIVERPVYTIETNIGGTEQVLKSALRYGCKTLVASTSEVYGKGSRIPFAEDDDILLGSTARCRWAYAASKMVDEFLALAYHSEFGLDVVPFRLFNTVGPRQTGRYGMVIPRFVRMALAGEPLLVHGDGTQQRCFCDVRDVVQALLGLIDRPEAVGRVFNIGSTEEVSIMELAQRTIALAGSKSQIKTIPYSEAYPPGFEDMARRVPDTSRVHQLLGWKPTRNLNQILTEVIAHERAHAKA